MDNISKSYDCRLIDICHVIDQEDVTKRDDGVIMGLKNIIKFFEEASSSWFMWKLIYEWFYSGY